MREVAVQSAYGRGGIAEGRVFLFLQGPASPFFRRLARALARQGATILKIHFCGGDLTFWPLKEAVLYRQSLESWPAYVREFLKQNGVTDLVLFGDCRPYHVVAIHAAKALGITLHLFEEGYLRPNWITLEHSGVNDRSDMPRRADQLLADSETAGPEEPAEVAGDVFRFRAGWDVLWAISLVAFGWLFPRYRMHTLLHPIAEYPGWIRRWLRRGSIARRDAVANARIEAAPGDLFLFPLQLDGDFQLRVHSRYRSSVEAAEQIMASFAAHAPHETMLVIKRHPFDVGPKDTRRSIESLAARYGLAERVVFLEEGDIAPLITRAAGVMVINSTSAIVALDQGKPLVVLGRATYDVHGLVHDGGLDTFWRSPIPPDRRLWLAYRHVLAVRTQVNGGYFSRRSVALALRGCVPRMLAATPLSNPERTELTATSR